MERRDAQHWLVVEAGPDTGMAVQLEPGVHLVGRSPHAAMCLTDRLVEPHHLQIEIGDSYLVTQLSGRFDIATRTIDGRIIVDVGATRLAVGALAEVPTAPPQAPRIVHSGVEQTGLTDDLAAARTAYRAQQRWLARHHPERLLLGFGDVRARIEVVDDRGSPLTVSDLAFHEQARYDGGFLVNDAPILARRDRPIIVTGDAPSRPRVVDGLDHRGVAVRGDDVDSVDERHARLELGDRWRATWVADSERPQPITVHLGLMSDTRR